MIGKKIKKMQQLSRSSETKTVEKKPAATHVQEDEEDLNDLNELEEFDELAELENEENNRGPSKLEEIDLQTDGPIHQSSGSFFGQTKFSDLTICNELKSALTNDLKFTHMTRVQERCIPYVLNGRDIIGSAKTGSGKTLAFLIPAIDILQKVRFAHNKGTGVIVITPTRELAQQIHDVALTLVSKLNKSVTLLIGGANRKFESAKLMKGVSIVIATPGRLLDHMMNTKGFTYHNLMMLVIDEADQIMKIGFEEELNAILKLLPTERQTVLFSATQTKKVDDLIRLSMKSPVYVAVGEENTTVENLEQGFVVCDSDKRFRLLYTFLKRNHDKKVMVFFSSCNSVKYHSDLLNYVEITNLDIHGKQKQQKRLNTYYEFCNAAKGVLLCTDVAARGLDIPKVDWIVQFDPPDEVREYIHRVGRTCRGADSSGKALLFLLPSEVKYLSYLQEAKVTLNEYEFPDSKLAPIQDQFERLVEGNFFLNQAARDAYKSYLHAYMSHSLKDAFDIKEIDLQKAAKSFGLTAPPRVDLDISLRKKKHMGVTQKKKNFLDPRERDPNDKRQFSR